MSAVVEAGRPGQGVVIAGGPAQGVLDRRAVGDRGRRGWAHRWPRGCRADEIPVLDVPAKLARGVRLLSTGHAGKSGNADALSVGIAAWSASALRAVQIDQAR